MESLSAFRLMRTALCGAFVLAFAAIPGGVAVADQGDGVNAHDLDGDGADDFALEYELLPDDSEDSSLWFM